MSEDLDLDALHATAAAVQIHAPGPWGEDGVSICDSQRIPVFVLVNPKDRLAIAYGSSFDPPTCLALVAEVRRQREVIRLGGNYGCTECAAMFGGPEQQTERAGLCCGHRQELAVEVRRQRERAEEATALLVEHRQPDDLAEIEATTRYMHDPADEEAAAVVRGRIDRITDREARAAAFLAGSSGEQEKQT